MPQEVYTLRRIWPNIPDRIVQCTADLYRIYSCRRYLYNEAATLEPIKTAAFTAAVNAADDQMTMAGQQENLMPTDGDLQQQEQQQSAGFGSFLEVVQEQPERELSPLLETESPVASATIQIPMPTFILSSASPEPHEVRLRNDSIFSMMSPPLEGAEEQLNDERRMSNPLLGNESPKALNAESTLPDMSSRRPSRFSPSQMSALHEMATTAQPAAPVDPMKALLSKTVAVDTMAFAHITGLLMELDDLAVMEKYAVLKLLMKSRIYERIVVKALCKAKLFEEIKDEETEQPMADASAAPKKPSRPPIPAKAPEGCPYNDMDFYMFAILALYYFECGFLLRPQQQAELKLESVQMVREIIKEARIPISAAFAKLHIAAQVRTVSQMLAKDEQMKIAFDESATVGPREGLVYLFMPDEFQEAQFYLCDKLGADRLNDSSLNKSSAVEDPTIATSNFVSVFTSRKPAHDAPPQPIGSLLPREKHFRFAFTIPASSISRQLLLESILMERNLLFARQQSIVNASPTESVTEETTATTTEQQAPSQQPPPAVEKQPTMTANAPPDNRCSTAQSFVTQSAVTPLQRDATVMSLAPIGVRINYRCQDRFSALAMYAAINFLPTSHAGQTLAPIIPVIPNGENEIPSVPVSFVVTGLTAPNQLSGLVRLLHYIRLSGSLALGPLESVLIYGLAGLSKHAHNTLAAIAAEPATCEAVKFVELYDEEFTTESLEDERFRSVKVALVFGDVAADVDFMDDPITYSSFFFDQPSCLNHPITKTNSGAVVDAICMASESSHLAWLLAVPSLEVMAKAYNAKYGHKTEVSDVGDVDGRSRQSSIFPSSEEEEDDFDMDLRISFKRGKKDKKEDKKGRGEEKRGGKASLIAPPPATKGGKKGLTDSRAKDRSSILSIGSNKSLLTQRLNKLNLGPGRTAGSRASFARSSMTSGQSTNTSSPAPAHFSQASLKPNSTALKLYQATIHAAKLPEIQTIVVAIRNPHTGNYGEEFVQAVMKEINEISVVTTAPKITVTAETPLVKTPSVAPSETTASHPHQMGNLLTPDATRQLPVIVTPHILTPTTGAEGSVAGDQAPGSVPLIMEPPKPTHKISSQLHLLPIPLTANEILDHIGAPWPKEEAGKPPPMKPTVLPGGKVINKLPSEYRTGTSLRVGTSMSVVSPGPASSTGGEASLVSGIYFDPNNTLNPEMMWNNFVFGGYMAAISITRVPVGGDNKTKAPAGKGRRLPQQQQQQPQQGWLQPQTGSMAQLSPPS